MGNSNFECEDLCLDDENKLSSHAKIAGAGDISVQCQMVVDGYGKVPRFRKKSSASQPVGNKIIEGHDKRSIFTASQPSIGSPKPKSQGLSKPMIQGFSLHANNEDPKHIISMRCPKLDDGYGKVARFGKKSSAAQAPGNKISVGHESETIFPASQPSVGSPKPQSQGPWKPKPQSQGPLKPSPGSPKPKSQIASKLSPGSPRPQSEKPSRSSQDPDIPPYESKDKNYWFCAFKREKASNRDLENVYKNQMVVLRKFVSKLRYCRNLLTN